MVISVVKYTQCIFVIHTFILFLHLSSLFILTNSLVCVCILFVYLRPHCLPTCPHCLPTCAHCLPTCPHCFPMCRHCLHTCVHCFPTCRHCFPTCPHCFPYICPVFSATVLIILGPTLLFAHICVHWLHISPNLLPTYIYIFFYCLHLRTPRGVSLCWSWVWCYNVWWSSTGLTSTARRSSTSTAPTTSKRRGCGRGCSSKYKVTSVQVSIQWGHIGKQWGRR